MHGYTGQVLRLDLTHNVVNIERLNERWARDFVGGRGLATKYLYESMDPSVDALSPENVLVLASGPITGTNGPSAAPYMVVTKSPLTGAITHSNSGGHRAPELRFRRLRPRHRTGAEDDGNGGNGCYPAKAREEKGTGDAHEDMDLSKHNSCAIPGDTETTTH